MGCGTSKQKCKNKELETIKSDELAKVDAGLSPTEPPKTQQEEMVGPKEAMEEPHETNPKSDAVVDVLNSVVTPEPQRTQASIELQPKGTEGEISETTERLQTEMAKKKSTGALSPEHQKEQLQTESNKKESMGGASPPEHEPHPTGYVSPPKAKDAEDFAKQNPDGLYLLFDKINQGSFIAKFSKEYIPEALAFAKPSTYSTIPAFKYKQQNVVKDKVQMGKKPYFEGWLAFVKEARLLNSEFVILPVLEYKEQEDSTKYPPMKLLMLSGNKLVQAERGLKCNPIKLKFISVAACVPDTYTGLDQALKPTSTIEQTDFLTKVKTPQDFAYIELTN